MGWYDTNPNRVMDARLAYEGAGAIGRGLKGAGDAVSGYAKLKYKKKRDLKDDELAKLNIALGHENNATKINVANIGFEGKKYQTDGSVQNNIRSTNAQKETNKSREKIAKTNTYGKVKSAQVKANASIYGSNVSASNNKRTNSTNSENSKRSAKAQVKVSENNLEGKRVTAKSKKKSKHKDFRAIALKNAKTAEERERILRMKPIGDVEIK